MNADSFLKNILTDVKVKAAELYDSSFETKSFFGNLWPASKHPKNHGSTLLRTSQLRNSINYNITNNTIIISSPLPYASIHNNGGTIIVTAKMKAFFWWQYKQVTGSYTTKKDGSKSNNKRNVKLTAEAEMYKAMALLPIGYKIIIKQRQYIGPHPVIDTAIETIVTRNVNEVFTHYLNDLKTKIK
jgi:phage gpG-like protein